MTLALRFAVRSDVGLLREGNEDSAYAGPRLLAVADGMGGHAAGEVASAVAISSLTDLDEDMPGTDLLDVLADAVAAANNTLREMVARDPAIEGMGTTLTAMLWSGTRVALVHIGDSRAYLLRDRQFYQITRDHTLVQSLVDEGRISPDEVATHPQRSLLLRALGSAEAEPDLSLREARAGDRYLLCSDGLSGVVSEETLHKTLSTVADPDEAVVQLIELAIRGGGPDNVTCIVADVVDSATAPLPPTDVPVLAGAASNGNGRPPQHADTPARRARLLTQTAPQPALVLHDDEDMPGAAKNGHHVPGDTHVPRRRWPIVTTILVVLAAVVVGGGYAGWRYTQSQYFVGADRGQVVIFRGINQRVAGISLSSVHIRTGIPLSQVPSDESQMIQSTISATGLPDAQRIVGTIRQSWQQCQQAYASLHAYQVALQHRPKPPRGQKAPAPPPAPTIPPRCPPQSVTPSPSATAGASATPTPSHSPTPRTTP
jgi:protein phosphatase